MILSDIATINNGINIARVNSSDSGSKIKLITHACLEDKFLDLSKTVPCSYPIKDFNKDKLILKDNDIILDPFKGECYIFESIDAVNYVIYQRFFLIKINSKYHQYIHIIASQIQEQVKRIIQTSNQRGAHIFKLSMKDIETVNINDKLFTKDMDLAYQLVGELKLLYQQENNLKQLIINNILKENHE